MKHSRTASHAPGAPHTAAQGTPEPAPGAPAEPVPPEPRLAELAAELARAKDEHLRAEADLQNARRRGAREIEEAERRGEARSFGAFLTLIDDLVRALTAAEEAGESDAPLTAGVRLVLARASDELARLGVVRIDPHGEPFDPREHEALLSAASEEHPSGHVTQVVSPGYRHGARLLRPARVIVSHGPATGQSDDLPERAEGPEAPAGGERA